MADSLLERLRVQQEWFSDGHGALHKEAADEIERLEAECFKLAAITCSFRSGDEHGNPYCFKFNTDI